MHGLLFSTDFLAEGIRLTPCWNQAEPAFVQFREAIADIFGDISVETSLNKAHRCVRAHL